MIDVDMQINAAERRVGPRALDAGEARVVTLTRTYDTSIHDLWDAVTNPERIPRWFLPVSGDLRPGGRYQLEGNAGGTIGRCDPPHGFDATWEFGGSVSWVEVALSSPAQDQTRLELAHITLVADDDKWSQFGPGAVGVGWDMALVGLSEHIHSGRPVDPEEARAWSTSDEGRRFVSLSADGWRDAQVAAGGDAAEAKAAAERTEAFYTGTPAPSGT
jgi:uncharacterized protein YndB with AHSA1/START domain